MCHGLGYWQRAIASRPTTAVRAYILGGMSPFPTVCHIQTTDASEDLPGSLFRLDSPPLLASLPWLSLITPPSQRIRMV